MTSNGHDPPHLSPFSFFFFLSLIFLALVTSYEPRLPQVQTTLFHREGAGLLSVEAGEGAGRKGGTGVFSSTRALNSPILPRMEHGGDEMVQSR